MTSSTRMKRQLEAEEQAALTVSMPTAKIARRYSWSDLSRDRLAALLDRVEGGELGTQSLVGELELQTSGPGFRDEEHVFRWLDSLPVDVVRRLHKVLVAEKTSARDAGSKTLTRQALVAPLKKRYLRLRCDPAEHARWARHAYCLALARVAGASTERMLRTWLRVGDVVHMPMRSSGSVAVAFVVTSASCTAVPRKSAALGRLKLVLRPVAVLLGAGETAASFESLVAQVAPETRGPLLAWDVAVTCTVGLGGEFRVLLDAESYWHLVVAARRKRQEQDDNSPFSRSIICVEHALCRSFVHRSLVSGASLCQAVVDLVWAYLVEATPPPPDKPSVTGSSHGRRRELLALPRLSHDAICADAVRASRDWPYDYVRDLLSAESCRPAAPLSFDPRAWYAAPWTASDWEQCDSQMTALSLADVPWITTERELSFLR